ncbi:MAG: hypothetical protein KA603_00310 [Azonexus sp.]|nr:hypothetical protein [Betaproteobacteria bacterium]MBK8918629.1 hypothetical protein [Betaproteobacteria bacterium]MBP6034562.1 hypothetical protein [Azonexus sp.]MBP6905102.1 hypothetical protein [Azonexus sp.]
MPDLIAPLRRGVRLPPSGWALAGMLAFYVVAGLFGRDPWKGEDAIHIGTAWHILSYGDWLSPDLAGRPFNEPPLYYWSAALTGKLLGWLLPLHDAMRFASGVWVALALTGIYYGGRELYGQHAAAASPMLLAGCCGLLLHAHDAQPMLIALAAYGGVLGALAACPRKPRMAGVFYGLSLGACLLGAGVAPTLPLLAAGPLALALYPERRQALITLGVALPLALAIALPWPLVLQAVEPERFAGWVEAESAQLSAGIFPVQGAALYLSHLTWFAFPASPIALWALWLRRRTLAARPQSLPLLFLALTLALLAVAYRPREIPALLLLPPLALLATPGALSLRRGAANAFDSFAMMTFTFFAALVWVAWSAMALGWPERLAGRVVALRPGFVGQFDVLAFSIAALATAWWLWLIVTAPRSPYRSLTHWTMGFTTLWLLAIALLLPWVDYGKSYRPVAQAVARHLPDRADCLAERGLNGTQRASFAYFAGLEPLALATQAGRKCRWLLVQADTRAELAPPAGAWTQVWEGNRPGERREKFRLYRRGE